MDTAPSNQITRLLEEARDGQSHAATKLLPLVYTELQQLAGRVFANERRGHTLQPTALVHEAWLKLTGKLGTVEDRRHFYAIAAQAMRRVLTDHARACRRQKRSGGKNVVTLNEELIPSSDSGLDLVELDSCLTRLADLNERHARIVELRFLTGLSIPETADTLQVSHATVERDWNMARAWLRVELSED